MQQGLKAIAVLAACLAVAAAAPVRSSVRLLHMIFTSFCNIVSIASLTEPSSPLSLAHTHHRTTATI